MKPSKRGKGRQTNKREYTTNANTKYEEEQIENNHEVPKLINDVNNSHITDPIDDSHEDNIIHAIQNTFSSKSHDGQ